MSDIDLTTQVSNSLELRHPFWIASAHYTERESVINAWAEIQPAALTLKTASKGPIKQEDKLPIRRKTTDFMQRLSRSYYCDGPKQRELITYEVASQLLNHARQRLPDTKVGISVLCGPDQDYDELRDLCRGAAFCELNLKYIFRLERSEEPAFFDLASKRFADLLEQVRAFTKTFRDVPVFIKLSRELTWLPGTKEMTDFLSILAEHGCSGIIIANSLKLDIPVFVSNGQECVLRGGVVCGESLFDQTISLIEAFQEPCARSGIPIVATGGMIDPEHTLMALKAGASAIQLCTAFDYYHLNYYNTLCWNLQSRIELLGLRSFREYLERLRREFVATIYNMPFMYFEQFWSPDIQRRLQNDIRASQQVHMFLMSGRTLVDRWDEALRHRFRRNLGLRLLLPNPDRPAFEAIQRSWGLTEQEVEARKNRVRDARDRFEKAWSETAEERRGIEPGDEEADLRVLWSDQCPFYSFYLFDDKVCVCPYPFTRPGESNVPVYVFFAGSREYERIKKEALTLFQFAEQAKP